MPHTTFCVRVRARDLRHRIFDVAPDLCLPLVDSFLDDTLRRAIAEGLDDEGALGRSADAADARALVECGSGETWARLGRVIREIPAQSASVAA